MRGSLRASDKSASRRLGVLLQVCVCVVACLPAVLSCSHAAPRRARPPEPPPRVLAVGLEQVALRTSAWVELHAWLAHAARAERPAGDPELDRAARAYAAVLADDERDELLGRTTLALQTCDDERCAVAAVTGTLFAKPYLAALPGFLARHWTERAAVSRGAIEVARSAMSEELEPLVTKIAQELAIEWPLVPPIVDIVSDAPEPGREAPIRVLLAARGACFYGPRGEPTHVHNARIMDCAIAYAVLRIGQRSAIARAMSRALPDREWASAWTALVVHAVATVMTASEPRHVSVLRRSAQAVMPKTMEWLASEWPSRLRGEPPEAFGKRYAAADREP